MAAAHSIGNRRYTTDRAGSDEPAPLHFRSVKIKSARLIGVSVGCAIAACALSDQLLAKTGPGGMRFDEKGKVTLHRGEPCTSQIMFVFRAGKSSAIPMAASMQQTKILTDAAHHNRRVHVSGRWRRGKPTGCAYVDVTQVEMEKSFWVRTFGNQ